MINLNSLNGADKLLAIIQKTIMNEFPDEELVGVEMGVAYGGGVESLGKMWKGRGVVWGFDTFTGHPKQLSTGPESTGANCMDGHYKEHGKEKLSIAYQRAELARQELDVLLLRGLIDHHSCWFLHKIHYCLLDLDILSSMKDAYEAVRHRIVDRGVLCLHDVVGPAEFIKALPELHRWYEEIKKNPQWEVVGEYKKEALAVLMKVR
jgi:hypothetical protein